MSEKFNEAFDRFERDIDIRKLKSYHELEEAFLKYKGIPKGSKYWKPSQNQTRALKDNWDRLNRTLSNRALSPYFSRSYLNFQVWQNRTIQVTPYRRRILNYMERHPNATLREARGHRKK